MTRRTISKAALVRESVTSALRRAARALASAATLAALIALPGCDNPACVFGPNGCQNNNDGGALCAQNAAQPDDHQWLDKGAPSIDHVLPSGAAEHPDTPIVVIFSESMSSSSLQNAFQLVPVGGVGQFVPLLPGALVGDGRMLVLFPATSLPDDASFELRLLDDAVVTDLQGCQVSRPEDSVVGRFGIADAPPATPKVVATWPRDGADDQSPTGEIVVVFDREVDADSNTVTKTSFDVKVGGVDPTFDPVAQALLTFSGGLPLTDPRVYRYRSLDDDDEAVVLGIDVDVVVSLSPAGNKIRMEDGSVLPATTFDFHLLPFTAPTAAEIVSQPTDAIGIDNLTGGSSKVPPLEIAVTLDDALPDDVIGIFVVGRSATNPNALISVYREVEVADVAYDPINEVATLGEAELNLAKSVSPIESFFGDGTIAIAIRRQRGNAQSPVRMLDADVVEPGTQNPLIDTEAPELTAWNPTGSNKTQFRWDVRNFTLIGRASESLRSVEVSTALGDNGVLPPVVASNDQGLFIAQPFAQAAFQDPLDPAAAQNPLAFTATLYDRALNASTALSGQFTQLGAVHGQTLPQASIRVEVFDQATLAAIVDARVFVHQDLAGTVTPVTLAPLLTSSTGVALAPSAGAGETIVTVDAAGYELFTLHGLEVDHLSVGLSRSTQSAATTSGDLTANDGSVTNLQRDLHDSRSFRSAEPLVDVGACSVDPLSAQLECVYGPYSVQPGRIGALAGFVTDVPTDEFNYSAQGFLKGFDWRAPFAPISAGNSQTTTVGVGTLLDDSSTDVEDRALDGPQLVFSAAGAAGIDVNSLDGAPRALIEGEVPGLPSVCGAGIGVAFVQGVTTWKIRSAFPGDVDPTDTKYPNDQKGELIADGSIDPDLMLRCEVRDLHGARALRRPRLSSMPGNLAPLDVAVLTSPTPGSGHTGAAGFDVQFTQAIPDGLGQPGLYRVNLVGSNGRAWRLLRFDPSGAGQVAVHAPDIALLGGTTLPNGTIACTIESASWPTFDSTSFFWTDWDREFDGYSSSAPASFAKP